MIEIGKVIILPTGTPGKELRSVLLPKRRRRWSWRKAWDNLRGILTADNLLTVAGIAATGMFLAYLALGWVLGVPW